MSRSLAVLAKDLQMLATGTSLGADFDKRLHKEMQMAFKPYNDVRFAPEKAVRMLIDFWLNSLKKTAKK